jgi:putative ABC transport system substrate-binding protein
MKKPGVLSILFVAVLLAVAVIAKAQQPKVNRVGVITSGGAWSETIDGLRVGLRQLGLEEGKQLVLAIRDTKGDLETAEKEAMYLEQEKVKLIYTTASSVTMAARRATTNIPIVFCAGADPVELGLVESFAKPGGRLTGVFYRDTDLTAKRLEILKELVPKLRRVVTFYDPRNPVANESAKLALEAARQLGLELVERHFASVKEFQAGIRAFRAGDAGASSEWRTRSRLYRTN